MAVDFENRIDDTIEFECRVDDNIEIDLSTVMAVKVPLPIALQDKDIEPTTSEQVVNADKGFSGLGTVKVGAVTSDIDENITARNIRGGVTILGVTGDLEPDKPDQSKVVEPSTSEQVITADSGYELASVTIKPVTAEIDSDIVAENIRKDTEILGVVGTMEAREDLDTELAEQETLIAELESGVNELPDKPVDRLQWKCDNIKSLAYEFFQQLYDYQFTEEKIIEVMKGVDTSKVKTMTYMFASNTTNNTTVKDLSSILIDAQNCIESNYMFKDLTGLTKAPTITNFGKVTNAYGMYYNCKNLENASRLDTSSLKNVGYMFYNCEKLETIELTSVMNVNSFYNLFVGCKSLKNLILKNIKISLQIGSGTTYGTLLTDESIVNTIQELWDNTNNALGGTRTLTMSTPSKARTDEIYVKLIDITDEMRAEDEYIDNKKPCVVCESTDDGAMTLKEYGISKNWNISK